MTSTATVTGPFTDEAGAQYVLVDDVPVQTLEQPDSASLTAAGTYDEDEHPRGPDGRFLTKEEIEAKQIREATAAFAEEQSVAGMRDLQVMLSRDLNRHDGDAAASRAKQEVARNIAVRLGSEHDEALVPANIRQAADDPDAVLLRDARTGELTLQHVPAAEELSAMGYETPGEYLANLKNDGEYDAYSVGGSPEYLGVAREGAVSGIVGGWAQSSNQTAEALAIQTAAAQEFGLELHLDAEDMGITSDRLDKADRLLEEEGGAYRAVLRAMHAETQEQFAREGITHIEVHRGFAFNEETGVNPLWAQRVVKNEMREGASIGTIMMRPISSFSADIDEARGFAGAGSFVGSGVVVTATVPVSDVLSCPRSGFGCLDESEFTLLHDSEREYRAAWWVNDGRTMDDVMEED